MIALLTLIIGLLVGYYARTVRDYVKQTRDMLLEKFDKHQAGVVAPTVSRATRQQPINLESETGGVMRPSPNQVALNAMIEREKKIKAMQR